jgi:RNA polymerase sigma-70 factor, ECF subfamily
LAQDADNRHSEAALSDIFVCRFGEFKKVVAGMGMSVSDGEDVLQDVFIQATHRPGEYRNPDEAFRWLMRVTVNQCLLRYRQRKRDTQSRAKLYHQAKEGQVTPEQAVVRKEEIDMIREALDTLDETLAGPLVLRYFLDMDSTRISEILNIPAGTVRRRLMEGRMILAKRLMERGLEG